MLELIVATIFIATVMNVFFTKMHIPTIIGYIATGVAISYLFGLHSEKSPHELELIAEFGIVFLMFTIGLEFSIHHLSRMRKEVFWHGGLQVGISLVLFYLVTHYGFGVESKSSVIIASAMALSSTAIVLKILASSREISKEYGQRAMGILIFQDIMVVPILLMLTIFSSRGVELDMLLWHTAMDAGILFLVLWFFGRYVLEPFLDAVVGSNSDEIFIGSILFLVMGASLLAHSLGFSYSLGALIAGMIIAETRYKHQVEADLIPFRDLLLGIFFITVGMQIDFSVIANHYLLILGLLLLFGIVKMAIIYLILIWVTSKRVALKTALALFQLGEFGLVVFELAGSKGLVDQEIAHILIVTIILSMIITPFVLRQIPVIANYLYREEEAAITARLSAMSHSIKDHVIVLGYGLLGHRVCEKLERRGVPYIAVEKNIQNVKEAQRLGKRVIFGNAAKRSILESIQIHNAASVIVAMDNSENVHLVCEILRQAAPEIKVVIKVGRYREKEILEKEFPGFRIVVGTEQVARGMVESMLKCDLD
jgi:CPA2 family monovalent cation:H+ antiporter-2